MAGSCAIAINKIKKAKRAAKWDTKKDKSDIPDGRLNESDADDPIDNTIESS